MSDRGTTISWTWNPAVPGFGELGEEQSLWVDAIARENPRVTAEATEHAVEQGAAITDHVRPGPRTLTLDGVISDAPTREPRSHMGGVVAERREGALAFSGPFDRTRIARDVLRALVESGTPVTIVTGIDTYEGFILTSCEVRRDSPAGGLLFVLEARGVRVVETQVVEAPRELRARRRRDRGEQDPAPDSTETDNRSAAARAADMARDSDTAGWLRERLYGPSEGSGIQGSGW